MYRGILTTFIAIYLSIWNIVCYDSSTKHATAPHINVLEYGESVFMEVIEPEDISYLYKLRPAKNFGSDFTKQHYGVALVPGEPYHGCSPLTNIDLILNSVALIQRGGCSFVTKTFNAEQAGAIAIIITDQDEENDSGSVDMIQDGTERDVTIPALYLLGKDGYMIKKTIERYHLPHAVINIPINITSIPLHQRHNRPPWVLW